MNIWTMNEFCVYIWILCQHFKIWKNLKSTTLLVSIIQIKNSQPVGRSVAQVVEILPRGIANLLYLLELQQYNELNIKVAEFLKKVLDSCKI
jgi:hypothetical protein